MSKIILTSGTAPSTPTSGTVAIYSDANDTLRFKDDTGTDVGIVTVSVGGITTLDKLQFEDHGSNAQMWLIEEDSNSPTNALVFDYSGTERLRITPSGRISTSGIIDSNGNDVVLFGEIALAVNKITITNSATGNGPIISSTGSDTNIDLTISAKGSGIVNLGSGGVKLNAGLDANNNTITNLGAPVGPNDASTKNYIDNNHGLDNVFEDTTPQLGGNLHAGTFSIIIGIGETVLSFSTDGEGATNWLNVSAALTSTGPTISAVGTDTNIDLVLDTKGTGDIDVSTNKIVNVVNPTLAQDAATKDYVDTEITAIPAPIPAFRVDAGPVTLLPSDRIVVLTGAGIGQAVALPPVGAVPAGTTFTLKNGVGSTGSIITPDGADTIDAVGGANAGLLAAPLAFTRLISDAGINWYVA